MALIVKNSLINWIVGLNPVNFSGWNLFMKKMLRQM
jgi:hypothetical protein